MVIRVSTGHVYQTSHLVSTKFAIVVDFLLLYFVISHHLVTGSIIVTSFNIICYLHFIRIYRLLWDLHIVYSAVFLLLIYQAIYRLFSWPSLCWHTSHFVTSLRTVFLMPGQYKCWQIIAFVKSNLGWSRYVWYHLTTYIWSNCGITILLLNLTRCIVFRLPRK